MNIKEEYFEWMFELVCAGRYARAISYRRLMEYLHSIEFTYIIPNDANRAEDGIDLRRRFVYERDLDDYIFNPKVTLGEYCSVLEMMIALSIKIETFMDDPRIGNRTGQWFWKMITNLGLGSMNDNKFDKNTAKDIIETFLDREYEPDGRGGLFMIRDCEYDLRDVEIWIQLNWYLNSIA